MCCDVGDGRHRLAYLSDVHSPPCAFFGLDVAASESVMHSPVFVQIHPLKPPLRPMEQAARWQQDLALGIAEHQRAVVEGIDDAKQLDLEGGRYR